MEKNWVKIYTSPNFYRAEIIKQMLNENDVDAVLINKKDSSYNAFGVVEVWVHEENFSTAIELINQI
jgi:benzoyl-CoA reductase/2-hydroxyglutaryl-CoA dehydratase subunit BcrC/BadD/HgdB